MPERTTDIRVLTSELVKRMNQDTRRIRNVEQRMDRIEMGISALEETVQTQMQDLKNNLGKIVSDIKNVSEKLITIEAEISKMNKELERKVGKTELKQLEAYINLISPMTTKFVTKEELERAIEEKSSKRI